MKMYSMILLLVGMSIMLQTPTHAAVPATRIIVVVNKDAITDEDLTQRIRLLNLGSGKPTSSPVSEELRKRVLEGMVEELLQLQAAKAKKINIEMAETEKGLENIAKENKMSLAQMVNMLKSHGITKQTMLNRIKAQMAWARYIREMYGPLVHIADQEVDTAMAKAGDVKVEEPPIELMDLKISQATFDLSPETPDALKMLIEQQIDETFKAKGCQAFIKAAEGLGTKVETTPSVKLGQIQGPLKALVQKATVGKCLEPMRTPNGMVLIMVCSKSMPVVAKLEPPTRETAFMAIEQEKLGKRAQQEMAKLKAVACIEYK